MATGTAVSDPSVPDLRSRLAPGQRLLGLDVGTRTLGMAVSDPGLVVATPLDTLRRRKLKDDVAGLRTVVEAKNVGGLVFGLPVSMDGSEGPRCQSVRQFARDVTAALPLPAGFWDERLSTAAVERMLIKEADASRRRRAQVIDKLAAAYILQGALDALSGGAQVVLRGPAGRSYSPGR